MANEKTEKSCCFFGHKNYSQNPRTAERLTASLEALITDGYSKFYFGRYGNFDLECYKLINALKEKYPHIKRIFVQACDGNEKNPGLYDAVYKQYDGVINCENNSSRLDFMLSPRNRAIIDMSDFCFFFVLRGGASCAALAYAKQNKKAFINTAAWENPL